MRGLIVIMVGMGMGMGMGREVIGRNGGFGMSLGRWVGGGFRGHLSIMRMLLVMRWSLEAPHVGFGQEPSELILVSRTQGTKTPAPWDDL